MIKKKLNWVDHAVWILVEHVAVHLANQTSEKNVHSLYLKELLSKHLISFDDES